MAISERILLNVNKIPLRQFVLLILLTILLLLQFLYMPMLNFLAKEKVQLEGKMLSIRDAAQIENEIEALTHLEKKFTLQLQNQKILFYQGDLNQGKAVILEQLVEQAEQLALNVERKTWIKNTQNTLGDVANLQLGVSGNIGNIKKLLVYIEQMTPYVATYYLSISERDRKGNVTLQLKMALYQLENTNV